MLLLLAQAAAFIPSSSFSTSVMRGHTSPHLTRPLVSRVAQPPSMLAAASVLSSPLVDPIATGFELVTLVPQPFWLLLILLPNWKVCAASLNGTLRHTAGRILIGILPGRRPAALHPFTHARPTPQGTRAVFEPIWPLALLGLVHLGIVGLSTQGALTLTLTSRSPSPSSLTLSLMLTLALARILTLALTLNLPMALALTLARCTRCDRAARSVQQALRRE